jgi:hypothetical protein
MTHLEQRLAAAGDLQHRMSCTIVGTGPLAARTALSPAQAERVGG